MYVPVYPANKRQNDGIEFPLPIVTTTISLSSFLFQGVLLILRKAGADSSGRKMKY